MSPRAKASIRSSRRKRVGPKPCGWKTARIRLPRGRRRGQRGARSSPGCGRNRPRPRRRAPLQRAGTVAPRRGSPRRGADRLRRAAPRRTRRRPTPARALSTLWSPGRGGGRQGARRRVKPPDATSRATDPLASARIAHAATEAVSHRVPERRVRRFEILPQDERAAGLTRGRCEKISASSSGSLWSRWRFSSTPAHGS